MTLKKKFKNCVFYQIVWVGLYLLLSSCGSNLKVNKTPIYKYFNSKGFKNQMSGLLVYDPATKDTLVNINGSQYFIPASNTKILTLYTALSILPKQMPLVRVLEIGTDTLLISGMGDPTPFHPYFKDSTLLNIIKAYKHVGIVPGQFLDHPYGPGWAWEDYDSYFSAERSSLPLFGNVLEVVKKDSIILITPAIFKSAVTIKKKEHTFYRAAHKNKFYLPSGDFKNEIPFLTSDSLNLSVLKQMSGLDFFISKSFKKEASKLVFSISRDSVLKRMMEVSDNFLAEQLLVNASAYLSDSLSIKPSQKYMLEGPLKNLVQKPRWVDGSGLSRYNLLSPISLVQVLEKLYTEQPNAALLNFFPAGGKSGTLSSWFKGSPQPYIFAKTGSLGNTFCLSGYLKTKRGKTFIFSYMNNHYTKPSAQIKKEMEQVLEAIRDHY
ncbi:MAG: D-alanyl-D-alanine carboxypeptidase/D-alanyl-D-alanine-endopeptidase (penicillin-binding protein 4) [Arcticibacterium sp.]|jgi:D-alanyl-D-alanine carboxypeptidase/D-alanyl-D-alanine-endopeptidase (penicillin-binding protein 4)